MRRLAAAGITTREACGNSVRNVTACPYAGVCPDESFDVTPIPVRCQNFSWAIPIARISAGNSSRPSAAARNMPAAWPACTTSA